MTPQSTLAHEESLLLLPWLANGRLSGAQRAQVEEHLRGCPACAEEAELQRRLCSLLTEPERVSHAPGPSFRKLMARLDAEPAAKTRSAAPAPRDRAAHVLAAAWRPPGLAWAATFVLTVGLGAVVATAYRWSQPLYTTYTAPASATPDVLHIAFDRSLPVGEVEELLRSAGARVVEGPGSTGVFGIAPVTAAGHPAAEVSPQLRALAARLRADARVRWIEPVGLEGAADDGQGKRPATH